MLFFNYKNIEIKERNPVKMDITLQEKQNQTIHSEQLGIFSEYFTKLKTANAIFRWKIMIALLNW
jgi:hypothetical protein